MRKHLLLSLTVLLAAPLASPADPGDSVVKVISSVRYPDLLHPWSQPKAVEATGSGVVIGGSRTAIVSSAVWGWAGPRGGVVEAGFVSWVTGAPPGGEKRILTNAHVVRYATRVSVQDRPGGKQIEARVEAIESDVDLAVLTLRDKSFFDKRPPLPRAPKLPATGETVAAYGFPVGGSDLSVTKGVVSRIGYGGYGYGTTSALVIQVSAAINPGNSGGPAVVNDKMIGVVYSRLQSAEGIGYVIPNEEIDLFLDGIKDGSYPGKPSDATWTHYHRLENQALRDRLGIPESTRGVLAQPGGPPVAGNPLREFDVVTRIGEHQIENDGMVRLPNGLRIWFLDLIPRLARNGSVPVSVIRQGKPMTLSLPVTTADNRLIKELRGQQPRWFIHGPLVFSPASHDAYSLYLRSNANLWNYRGSLLSRRTDLVQKPGEELVVITSLLFDHRIAKGYSSPIGMIVEQVNRQKVKNLAHLVALLRDSKEEYLEFRFAEVGAEVLVFRRTEMEKATEEILEDAGIAPTRRGSKDLLDLWNGKTGPKRP
jgi:S1-C subfamily serine protease